MFCRMSLAIRFFCFRASPDIRVPKAPKPMGVQYDFGFFRFWLRGCAGCRVLVVVQGRGSWFQPAS